MTETAYTYPYNGLTEKQQRRLDSFKRRVSVKGAAVGSDDKVMTIGWERSRDGRDMTTDIDADGRTISTRPTYSH